MCKLSILVPVFHETYKDIEPLIKSIDIQQAIDFDDIEIIFALDGNQDYQFYRDFKKKFPKLKFDFKLVLNFEHIGVSATRQSALDHASGEYVIFCDADDMFYSPCALWIIFNEINHSHFDTMTSCFIEQSKNPDSGEFTFINHNMDSTFVHGKVHRKQYLIDNDIAWNPDLTVHEDSFFNCLCQCCVKDPQKAVYCSTPFYLWRWRDNSVCRHDPDYILKTYNNMLDSNTALVNQLIQRDLKDKAMFYATNMIFDAYYTMCKKEWINQENQIYRKNTEIRFNKYWNEFNDLFNQMDEMQKNVISSQIRNRMITEGMPMENITFNDWIKQIEEIGDC